MITASQPPHPSPAENSSINSDKRNLSPMSPNYSSSSSTEHEMDGVAITAPQQTLHCPSSRAAAAAAATTTDQQVINTKTTLPLKSCLVHSRSRSHHSHSAATQSSARPELCELPTSSSRLDSGSGNGVDTQAQRHHVNSHRGRLTFNNRTRFYLVPTLEELTTAEFAATYRTPDEDTANQQEIVRTIQAMAQHSFHDGDVLPPSATAPTASATDELTTRGLEHMRSSAHVQERKQTKLMVTDVIFTEQEEQWNCGRTVAESEEDIADVARSVTSRCVQEALERAAGDAAYVRRVVAQDLCQQASNMQLGRSLHNLSPAADLPRTTTDTTGADAGTTCSITIPHPASFITQATPNPWSVSSTTPPTTTNTTLLDQIASNASMAMSNHNKNKMSTTTNFVDANDTGSTIGNDLPK